MFCSPAPVSYTHLDVYKRQSVNCVLRENVGAAAAGARASEEAVNVAEGNVVTVKGPKGELTKALRPEMILKQEGSTITVEQMCIRDRWYR